MVTSFESGPLENTSTHPVKVTVAGSAGSLVLPPARHASLGATTPSRAQNSRMSEHCVRLTSAVPAAMSRVHTRLPGFFFGYAHEQPVSGTTPPVQSMPSSSPPPPQPAADIISSASTAIFRIMISQLL